MKNIVKYNNFMNSLSLGSLGQSELDLLMTICAKMKELGTETVEFEFGEIREVAELKNCDSRDRFSKKISSLNRKLISISGHMEDDDEEVFFTLFNELKTLKKQGVLVVSVNPKYAFVLNDLHSNFTKFELEEFVKLKSKYSKHLYRLLKQMTKPNDEGECWRRFSTDELREKLGCPKSYQNKVFIRDILTPCVEELKPIFSELTLDIMKARRPGAPVTGYEFRWKPCVNDDLPGQQKLAFTDEEGKTQYRTVSQPRSNPKIHNYTERTSDPNYIKNLLKGDS